MRHVVGVTGTKMGSQPFQRTVWQDHMMRLDELCPEGVELHHGDCVGVDEEVHHFAVAIGWRTVIHPPIKPKFRAWCKGDVVLPEGEYLDRNIDIVKAAREMMGVSQYLDEQVRSGTWHAIRQTRRFEKPITIFWPDGRVTRERYEGRLEL